MTANVQQTRTDRSQDLPSENAVSNKSAIRLVIPNEPELIGVQIRMARVGVSLTIRQLAELTGLNKATIVRLEAGAPTRPSTLELIKQTLQNAGAEFLPIRPDGAVTVCIRPLNKG